MYPRRLDRSVLLLAAVIVVVIVMAGQSRRARANGQVSLGAAVVATVVSPLEKGFTSLARVVSEPVTMLVEIRGLYGENRRLRTEADRLRQLVSTLDEVALENRRLREMLRFRETLPDGGRDALPATIIGRGVDQAQRAAVIGFKPTNWYDRIIIDLGARHGVREKQMVLTPRGLVGQVRVATPSTATVLLITDLNSGVGARIQRTGWSGVVKGTAGPMVEMVYLPKEAEARKGDVVVTNGIGSVFHVKGIPIGTVQEIRLDENTSTKSATLLPAVDFRRLEEVLVLTR